MIHLTRTQVRAVDQRAIDEFHIPGIVLMENAGRGCAEWLMQLNPQQQSVLILCGPGNNGGDGFVIARHLQNHGWPVRVALCAELKQLRGDALLAFRMWQAMGTIESWPTAFESAWIVDALFGTGLTRPLRTPYQELIDSVNSAGKPVLAIDLPSGLDCDTGIPLGPTVLASHTATFVSMKQGFLNPVARRYTGEIQVIDIGAPRCLIQQISSSRGFVN